MCRSEIVPKPSTTCSGLSSIDFAVSCTTDTVHSKDSFHYVVAQVTDGEDYRKEQERLKEARVLNTGGPWIKIQ